MKFNESYNRDPFGVLKTTKFVVDTAHSVFIDTEFIEHVAKRVASKIEDGLEAPVDSFRATGGREHNTQLVFLQNVVNFCFWAEKDTPKWRIQWPRDTTTTGGWYTLTACFDRAISNSVPILDANYLSSISLSDTEKIFKGNNGIDIPLLQKRQENLMEAGRVLVEKYGGQTFHIVEQAGYDAVRFTSLVLDDFPSFRDTAMYEGKEVFFHKRAQIVSQDLGTVLGQPFSSTEALTAFADYRLPQILREFGMIRYRDDLARKIDSYELIEAYSNEEIEIRAATIWCVELLRNKLEKYTAGEIDYALWLLSQNPAILSTPHHRTYTIYY